VPGSGGEHFSDDLLKMNDVQNLPDDVDTIVSSL
jgi:hypothetical protein